MPAATIKQIIRKLISSIFSLMIITIFISCIPICIHNLTHNSKYTNFNKEYDDNTSIHNEDDERKNVRVFAINFTSFVVFFCLCCFLLEVFLEFWRERTLNNLYNRLFRNQHNEPAVHYRVQ